jgi:hypothetical protein
MQNNSSSLTQYDFYCDDAFELIRLVTTLINLKKILHVFNVKYIPYIVLSLSYVVPKYFPFMK